MFCSLPVSAGRWAASGTVLLERSFVLTRDEAEDLARKKRELELEVEFQKKRVEFYKELSEDAKLVLKYHREKSDDYRQKWLEAEDKQFKRTTRRDLFWEISKLLLFNRAIKAIRF